MKKIVIAGGTGFLGQVLIDYFKSKCEEIVILSRNKYSSQGHVVYEQWDGKTYGAWTKHLENADVLINLTGKSVDCRYNERNKKEILSSRIDSTKILNEAIKVSDNPPHHFINSSTATIYEHSLNRPNTEYEFVIGSDFSMDVAKKWEEEFFKTQLPFTRKTALRTSIVLGNSGGAFPKMKQICALGLGGKQGNGKQMISWIHALDYARSVEFIIAKKLAGAINITAPHPVQNEDFMFKLREKMQVSIAFNSPKFLLQIGAFFMQTETELLLKSRFVIPQRLLNMGFVFEFGNLNECFSDLMVVQKTSPDAVKQKKLV